MSAIPKKNMASTMMKNTMLSGEAKIRLINVVIGYPPCYTKFYLPQMDSNYNELKMNSI